MEWVKVFPNPIYPEKGVKCIVHTGHGDCMQRPFWWTGEVWIDGHEEDLETTRITKDGVQFWQPWPMPPKSPE